MNKITINNNNQLIINNKYKLKINKVKINKVKINKMIVYEINN